MATRTRPRTTQTDYTLAPWRQRLRWWLLARLWNWGQSFEGLGEESPGLANPLWRR